MNIGKNNKLDKAIKLVCAILFLMIASACSDEPLTISGKVLNESGAPLSDVTVWACYSGWGWGEAEGYLVWDKNYCSETTQTNHDGYYVITFKGPTSSKLKARKDGWVQTQDFNTTHSRIILTRVEEHRSTLRAEAKSRDLEHRRRRVEESETDYYCRVILPDIQPVNLNYKDDVLSITPVLLGHEVNSDALFAVRGLSVGVLKFSNEVVLKINGVAQDRNFSLMPVEKSCGMDVNFIGVNSPGLNEWPDTGVEILVPSISAMFDMQIWHHSIQK